MGVTRRIGWGRRMALVLGATTMVALGGAGAMAAETPDSDAGEDDGGFTTFGGGVIVKGRTPATDEKAFRDAGYDVVSDGKGGVAVVVDAQGKIYRDRNYHGIIPGIRDAFNIERFTRMSGKHRVCWVGFQPMASTSRVFWQLTHASPRYEVNKVDNQTIEVFFPGGRIDRRNNRRYIYTDRFLGPVNWIRGKNRRKGARYTVSLKSNARHSHRYAAPFLFLDVQ